MFSSNFTTLSNCFKIPELKSRILLTLLLLGIWRVASLSPTPGLDSHTLGLWMAAGGGKNMNQGLLGMYGMFTGGGFGSMHTGAWYHRIETAIIVTTGIILWMWPVKKTAASA